MKIFQKECLKYMYLKFDSIVYDAISNIIIRLPHVFYKKGGFKCKFLTKIIKEISLFR